MNEIELKDLIIQMIDSGDVSSLLANWLKVNYEDELTEIDLENIEEIVTNTIKY